MLCYTGEADGKYTGAMAGWGEAGNFFSSLARWTAGKSQGLGPGVVATQELRSGVCRVELHLDPGRDNAPFTRLPELTALCARPGEAAVPKKTRLNWASPDVLLAELPLVGSETILPTIDIPGVGQATLAPTCMPYSPEFLPRKPGQGAAALEGLAKATGGCERVNLPEIWKQVPRKPQNVPLSPYLLLLAAGIFLTEVLQRRTGVFSVDWRRLARLQGMAGWLRQGAVFKFGRRKAGAKAAPQGSSETDTDRAAADRPLQNKPEPSRAPPPAPKLAPAAKSTPAQTAKPAEPPADGMGDALSQAQQRHPATHGKEIGALPRSRVSRPVGATDNSPAIYRWGKDRKKPCARPVGTVERLPTDHVFGRPYGTIVVPVLPIHPAVNCWATVERPYGTKMPAAI